MAEVSLAAAERLLTPFLAEYNKSHSTEFRLESLEMEPEEDPSCDFRLIDDAGAVLKIQHSRAWQAKEDPIGDRSYQACIERWIIHPLQEQLEFFKLRGLQVFIDIPSIPHDTRQRRWIACGVALFVRWAVDRHKESSPDLVVRIDDDFRTEWKLIEPWVSTIDVLRIPEAEDARSEIQWNLVPGARRFNALTDAAVSAKTRAVEKASALGKSAADLVLLIEFDLDPFILKWDQSPLQAAFTDFDSSFREIWVAHTFEVPPPTAIRVWEHPGAQTP